MNIDRLGDKLDDKILEWNSRLFGIIAAFLLKPLAICSDPFFRKNFGERYLTGTYVLTSIILWNIAEKLSNLVRSIAQAAQDSMTNSPEIVNFIAYPVEHPLRLLHLTKTADWLHTHDFSVAATRCISYSFGFLVVRELIWIHKRRVKPGRWHSMSRGESIFGSENPRRDFLITVLASFLLFLFAPAIGLLFVCSRFASFHLASKQQEDLYHCYLDRVDAKIEEDFLQRSLKSGEPPRVTDGLYAPLPSAFKGEHRTNIARIIAPEKKDERSKTPRPHTTNPEPPSLAEMCRAINIEPWKERLHLLARYKRPITYILISVVALYVCTKTFSHFRDSWNLRRSNEQAADRKEPQPLAVTPPQEPSTRQDQQSQKQTTWPPSAVAPQQDKQPPVATAIVPVSAPMQRQPAQDKSDTMRRELFQQLQDAVDAQERSLAQFESECENQLSSQANLITTVSTSKRTRFQGEFETNRLAVLTIIQNQKTFITGIREKLQVSGPSGISISDLQNAQTNLAGTIPRIESQRKIVHDTLLEFTIALGKAQKGWHW